MYSVKQVSDIVNEGTNLLNQQSIISLMAAARTQELSISQINTLFHLRYNGSSRVSLLAGKLGITNAAASQMLNGLFKKGFITRQENPDDRRIKRIALSEKGNHFLNTNIKAHQQWLMFILRKLSVNERELLAEGMKILIEKTHEASKETKYS